MDLTGFRIPPAHRDAALALREMPDDQFANLSAAFEAASPFTGSAELTEQVAGRSGLDEAVVRDVVLISLSLYSQLKFHGWTKSDIATGVSKSDDLPGLDEASDVDEVQARLASRIEHLLSFESIVTTARALDLLTENEHLFHSARVLTDIRPVFGEDPAQPPKGALVTETLKLEYFDEGTIQSTFIALSRSELKNLRDIIDRALSKSDTVHELLEQIGLSHFDAHEEDS